MPLPRRFAARFLIPLVVLGGLIAVFVFGLHHDPKLIPSPLIGKPAPAFSLQTLGAPEQRRSLADFHGRPLLVNFFASWCADCRIEHPVLLQLAGQGVEVLGIDYKDEAASGQAWLSELGNPYRTVLADSSGMTAIDWGVYGVPETFVVNADGVIVFKQVGAVTPEVWAEQIQPLLNAGKTSAGGPGAP